MRRAQATTRVTIKRRERDGTNMKHRIIIHDQNTETKNCLSRESETSTVSCDPAPQSDHSKFNAMLIDNNLPISVNNYNMKLTVVIGPAQLT